MPDRRESPVYVWFRVAGDDEIFRMEDDRRNDVKCMSHAKDLCIRDGGTPKTVEQSRDRGVTWDNYVDVTIN